MKPATTTAAPTPIPSDIVDKVYPDFTVDERQQLEDEYAELYALLLQATADYEAEMAAREADQAALAVANGKVAELESEKNRLIAELGAIEVELVQIKPPVLDVKAIQGKYESRGELVSSLKHS